MLIIYTNIQVSYMAKESKCVPSKETWLTNTMPSYLYVETKVDPNEGGDGVLVREPGEGMEDGGMDRDANGHEGTGGEEE